MRSINSFTPSRPFRLQAAFAMLAGAAMLQGCSRDDSFFDAPDPPNPTALQVQPLVPAAVIDVPADTAAAGLQATPTAGEAVPGSLPATGTEVALGGDEPRPMQDRN